MENPLAKNPKLHLAVISILGWFALATQFYINLQNKDISSAEIVIRYFSFFTILTNLMVAVCCTSLLFSNKDKLSAFFAKTGNFTAITVYILIVGMVYNVILRSTWHPEGLQRIVDELLHVVVPLYYLIIWIFFVPKAMLKIRGVALWLIYPLVYFTFILIRGNFSGYYPYPFLNVTKFGINQILTNAVAIMAVFILVSIVLIAIGNALYKKNEDFYKASKIHKQS
jgi:hypothetical protein